MGHDARLTVAKRARGQLCRSHLAGALLGIGAWACDGQDYAAAQDFNSINSSTEVADYTSSRVACDVQPYI